MSGEEREPVRSRLRVFEAPTRRRRFGSSRSRQSADVGALSSTALSLLRGAPSSSYAVLAPECARRSGSRASGASASLALGEAPQRARRARRTSANERRTDRARSSILRCSYLPLVSASRRAHVLDAHPEDLPPLRRSRRPGHGGELVSSILDGLRHDDEALLFVEKTITLTQHVPLCIRQEPIRLRVVLIEPFEGRCTPRGDTLRIMSLVKYAGRFAPACELHAEVVVDVV